MYLSLAIFLSLSTAIFEFFYERSLDVMIPYGMVIPLLMLVPRFALGRMLASRGVTGEGWLANLELMFLVIVIFNAPASLFFHSMGFQYDRLLHFAMGLVSVPLSLIAFLVFAKILNLSLPSRRGIFISVFAAVFVGLFAWEGFQFSLDKIFGTRLFYDTVQPIIVDFWEDILFGFIGSLLGLAYIGRIYEKLKAELHLDTVSVDELDAGR